MLQLKGYQQRALDSLRAYFAESNRTGDADAAFYTATRETFGQGISYKRVQELPGLPYVCLRIPTGGGKTLVACHATGVAAAELLHTETPLVLWLVPSKAILQQTFNALKARSHPYRQALDAESSAVNIMGVEEALSVTPATLNSGTTIILSTVQSSRVTEMEDRRVYRDSGSLMDHFQGLPEETLAKLEHGEGGQLIHSLANVLKARRPIVIVDEAHNARTELSFETLARFGPSCIIEFTATPAREHHASNVLYSASAAELSSEEMIKMPIHLETRLDWRALLADAVACRNGLEEAARLERQETREYLRPIMLLQAQPRRRGVDTVTTEVVRASLIEDSRIPEEQVAVETGERRDLEGVDVLSPESPVRYVITVQALREGWDCPFAYVLCSVAEAHSSTAVEQILGRIMRLPHASWKKHDSLNTAYAFVASENFAKAAAALVDGLVDNGFERQDAEDLIRPARVEQAPLVGAGAFMGYATVITPEAPNLETIPEDIRSRLRYDSSNGRLTFQGPMTVHERTELYGAFETAAGKAALDALYDAFAGQEAAVAPAAEVVAELTVPVLAIRQGDLFEQLEETHLLDHYWPLAQCDASLNESLYPRADRTAEQGQVYVTDRGEIRWFVSALQQQMMGFARDSDWTVAELVHWLDRNIAHRDISSTETGVYLTRLVHALIEERGIVLADLVRDRYRLKVAVAARLDEQRTTMKGRAFQSLLDPASATPIVVTPECCFRYDPRAYPFSTRYQGHYEFRKHYYEVVGDLKAEGEQTECAIYIDKLPDTDRWVSNIPQREAASFWLQTSTDKFYPDFVCRLKDGRYLVVEYKGADRAETPDTREKRDLGELWEQRSNGLCLFVMVTAPDYDAIRRKVKGDVP